jgi:protein-S-isoprenylcysteine O-methyltransferase Ste14
VLGGLLMVAGAAVPVRAFVWFVVEGAGTPAPVAPTERLVVGGLYRYVRKRDVPGRRYGRLVRALLLSQLVLLWYAVIVWLAVAAFVRHYEEPRLSYQFGASYASTGKRCLPGSPGLRPWRPLPQQLDLGLYIRRRR